MAKRFHTIRFVEFSDTDMAGIVHFAAFFRYMESAEHELLRSVGLSVHNTWNGEAISFPRVAASCNFSSPARCEDVLDIEVAIKRLGGKSVTYQFHVRNDGREVAHGEMTSVCCRVRPGELIESIPIPDEIADGLRQFVTESQ